MICAATAFPGLFRQLASYVPGTEPCACTLIIIFDLCLLDIPSPHSRSSPHFGELFLSDRVNWYKYVSLVSLVCALRR